uniref:Uncharacterized protein n=1 Tax=Tetraselmis sp. GSL018 TaxID=582737 RepID=A0A061S329_9CHLO
MSHPAPGGLPSPSPSQVEIPALMARLAGLESRLAENGSDPISNPENPSGSASGGGEALGPLPAQSSAVLQRPWEKRGFEQMESNEQLLSRLSQLESRMMMLEGQGRPGTAPPPQAAARGQPLSRPHQPAPCIRPFAPEPQTQNGASLAPNSGSPWHHLPIPGGVFLDGAQQVGSPFMPAPSHAAALPSFGSLPIPDPPGMLSPSSGLLRPGQAGLALLARLAALDARLEAEMSSTAGSSGVCQPGASPADLDLHQLSSGHASLMYALAALETKLHQAGDETRKEEEEQQHQEHWDMRQLVSRLSADFYSSRAEWAANAHELVRRIAEIEPQTRPSEPSGSGAFASLMRLAESAEQPQNAQSPAEAAATPAAAAAANTDASPETVVHSLAALQSENGLKLLNQHIRRQRSRKRSRKAWQPRLTLGDRVLDLSAGSSLQPAVERAAGNSEAQTPRRPLPSLPAMPLPLAGASPQPPAPPPGGARLFSTPGSLPPPLSICMPVSVGSSNLEIAALCSSQPEPRSIAGAVPPDASGPAAPTGADGRDSDRAELLAKLAEVQSQLAALQSSGGELDRSALGSILAQLNSLHSQLASKSGDGGAGAE